MRIHQSRNLYVWFILTIAKALKLEFINFQIPHSSDEFEQWFTILSIILIGDKSGTMTVDTALDLLQAAAAEIEEESEVQRIFL